MEFNSLNTIIYRKQFNSLNTLAIQKTKHISYTKPEHCQKYKRLQLLNINQRKEFNSLNNINNAKKVQLPERL